MGKIYEVDFEDENLKTKTIQELFESIQLYRSEGKTLPSIHTAFQRAGLWQKAFNTFLREYYRHRKLTQQTDSKRSVSKATSRKTVSASKDKATASRLSADTKKDKPQTDNRTGMTADMTLAERRAFSAEMFRQRKQ